MSERMTSAQFKAKLAAFKVRSEAGENVEQEMTDFFINAAADLYDMFVSMEHNLNMLAFFAQNADERARG